MIMTLSIALVLSQVPTRGPALGAVPTTLPPEVRAYIARRDMCDHFRGEDAPDEERRAEIYKGAQRYCKGSDAQLAALKRRYDYDRAVRARLDRYDPRIED